MKILAALLAYLVFSGVVLGPIFGDEIRCGEDVGGADLLIWAVALPIAVGASVTSGPLPKTGEVCGK